MLSISYHNWQIKIQKPKDKHTKNVFIFKMTLLFLN